MMKMIIPIASPAAVSVIQVEVEPMKGNAANASTGTSASGAQSIFVVRGGALLAGAAVSTVVTTVFAMLGMFGMSGVGAAEVCSVVVPIVIP
ncbi:hypothetical protein [Noviherbaspirillum sp. Root189]|uniref:hypothetical protein n=1 Tax=Noviherbaspirillum sp. Root189 TaxID=1736487 RepID=UPI001F20C53A|nr:hypothetical protein [Noviherbaspirillum sp. Root189]